MCVWFLLRARGMIKEGLCGGVTSITRTLPDGTLVLVVRMSNKQISETYRLIQDSSKNDSGFGMDEFPTEADFREEIAGGHCFAVLSKDTGQLIGAFILADSKFYRGQKVVDPFIIVRRTERGRGLGDFCFKMAVEQAIALKYIGMYVDTFTTNEAMIRIIEKTGGFERVGFLPMGGRDKDGNIVSSYIYYRDLRKR